MKFRLRDKEPPEINLIPFIDVLLVILIFLMLSTTYDKYRELQVRLPTANAEALQERPIEILVTIDASGRYSINRVRFAGTDALSLSAALQLSAREASDPILVIHADADARHQSVVTLMDAARRAGLNRISFATQRAVAARSP